MAARGAIFVFAAAGVAIAALSSPAAAQAYPDATDPEFHLGVWWQQRTIDEIEADLTGLEAAVRWDGDPCRRIHRGASKVLDRLIDEEFLSSQLPLEMIRAWRARVDRLFKICPNESGFIGDPSVAARLSDPPPQDAGPQELAAWWTSEGDAIHNEIRRIEGLTDSAEISSANAKLRARIARLEQLYRSRQGKPYPALMIEHWTERSDRLIDRQRQLLEVERQRGNQSSKSRGTSTAQPTGEQKGANPIPRILNPLNILGGDAGQEPQSNTGNPIIKGLNILGGGNREPASDGNVQNRHDDRAAPANTKRKKPKDRLKRDRQRDRCDRNQGQVLVDCPNR